jgi:hypothetical protein
VQNPDPFEVHPIEEEPRRWLALASSVLAHVVIILLVLVGPFPAPEAGPVEPDVAARPIAIDPRIPFEARQSQPQAVPVPEEPVPLGPDADRPDPAPREASPEVPPPDEPDPEDEPPDDPEESGTPAASSEPPTRIATPRDLAAGGTVLGPPTSPFGRPSTQSPAPSGGAATSSGAVGSMGRLGFSSGDSRSWRESFPETTGQCVEIPELGTNPDGTPVLASVSGVVRDQAGRPLPGAHLQIVGASFATFSDGSGRYRLEFDPSLLQRCRVQLVRVSAAGYRDQSLNLAIGRNARSDDVRMRRR